MGPTIILDKSSLQAFSKKELVLLNKLYYLNIPPILITEILADLKKEKSTESLSKDKIIEISNKLIQRDNAINVHYRDVLVSSLMGTDYMGRRNPLVAGGRKVRNKKGKIGVYLVETEEQQAIRNWQKGNFSEAEKILAQDWRNYTKEIDLEENKKRFSLVKKIYPTCKDYLTLIKIVETLIDAPNIQNDLLFEIIEGLQLKQNLASAVFYRWETDNQKLLKSFAPCLYFFTKIEKAFRLGIVYELITTRPTNKIDCEYIYYLPFSNIFSSRDNFHKNFAINFLEADQTFIDGDLLKDDLRNIILLLEKEDKELNIDWDTSFSIEPPANENSITYKMWKKYMPLWTPNWFYRKNEYPKKDETVSKGIDEETNTFEYLDVDPFEKFKDEDHDFIYMERYITLEDQCPCGSGKKFKDCCYEKTK